MFKITNTEQALDFLKALRLKFPELLKIEMEEAGLSSGKLSGKMSKLKNSPGMKRLEEEGVEILGSRAIRYYQLGKRGMKRPLKRDSGNLLLMAEALCIEQDELLSDTASVNRALVVDLDDEYSWQSSIEDIKYALQELPAEQAKQLCKSYRDVLSIPRDVLDLAALYSLLNEESRTQFLMYMDVLLNEGDNPSPAFYEQYSPIFDMFETDRFLANNEGLDSGDLFELVKKTFPHQKNTEDADAFCSYLFFVRDKAWCDIARKYLSLNEIKREMSLRLVDQLYAVLPMSAT